MAIELVDQHYVIFRSLYFIYSIMDVILYWLVDIHYQKNTKRTRESRNSGSWRPMLRHLFLILLYGFYMAVMCWCGASLDVMTKLVFGGLVCSFLLCVSAWYYDKRHKIEVCNMETASRKRKLWKSSKFFGVLAWMVVIIFIIISWLWLKRILELKMFEDFFMLIWCLKYDIIVALKQNFY